MSKILQSLSIMFLIPKSLKHHLCIVKKSPHCCIDKCSPSLYSLIVGCLIVNSIKTNDRIVTYIWLCCDTGRGKKGIGKHQQHFLKFWILFTDANDTIVFLGIFVFSYCFFIHTDFLPLYV